MYDCAFIDIILIDYLILQVNECDAIIANIQNRKSLWYNRSRQSQYVFVQFRVKSKSIIHPHECYRALGIDIGALFQRQHRIVDFSHGKMPL